MDLDVLQNLSQVYEEPYPHVVIHNALPENIYNELDATFPINAVQSIEAVEGITHKLNTHDIEQMKVPNIWQEFCAYHTSKAHVDNCINLFQNKIKKLLGEKMFDQIIQADIKPRRTYEDRNNDDTLITSECQLVVHKPLPEDMTTRSVHLDNPGEIYAGLLYMKPKADQSTGGDFVIHESKPVKKVKKRGGRPVDQRHHNPVKTIEYQPNTFVMFLNLPRSVHGVTPRLNAVLPRRSVNIIAEFNEYVTPQQMYYIQEQ